MKIKPHLSFNDFHFLWGQIKEPAIKEALKLGTNLGIEFREMPNTKNYKYADKKVQKFFAVITTTQQTAYILQTQKSKVREFTEKSAYLWLKEIQYPGICIFRTDLAIESPNEETNELTWAQKNAILADGGPLKRDYLGEIPNLTKDEE